MDSQLAIRGTWVQIPLKAITVFQFLQKLSSVGFPLTLSHNFSSTWTVDPFVILLEMIRCWLKGPT